MRRNIAGFLHYRTDLLDGVRSGVIFSDCPEICHRVCCSYPSLPEHDFTEDSLEKARYDEKELVSYLLEEKALFSGGNLGITFLGKEPLQDPFYCKDVAKEIKKAGMNLHIWTCGMCPLSAFDLLYGFVDLYVVRLFSAAIAGLDPFYSKNAAQTLKVVSFLEKRGYPYRILIPVLPGINSGQADALSRFASGLTALKSVVLDFSFSGFSQEKILAYKKPFLEKRVTLY